MRSSTTGQNAGWPELAAFQSSQFASQRSSSASPGAANGVSSTDQSTANGASDTGQTSPFDSMMAMLLRTQGVANGQTGSTQSSGASDDAQSTLGQTTSGGGSQLMADLQSLLSSLSGGGTSSTAGGSTDASSASTTPGDLSAMLTKDLQAIAQDLETSASGTTDPSTSTNAASADTATSRELTRQTSLSYGAAAWFNGSAATYAGTTGAGTTGSADASGRQSGTTLNQQFAQAAAAYTATNNSNMLPPTTLTA